MKPREISKKILFLSIATAGIHSTLGYTDELDTIQVRAAINKAYDSNLFRQNQNEVSDQITTSVLGLKLDKSYSLQRFVFDLTYVDYKYQKSDFLDFSSRNYNGSWFWAVTPNFTGSLSSTRNQSLIGFRDLQTATQNIRTTETNSFNSEFSPYKALAIVIGLTEIKNENSRQFNAQTGSKTLGVEYGVKYTSPSGNNISILNHQRNGEFLGRQLDSTQQFDNGFVENEVEVSGMYQHSKSIIKAKAGFLEREHDHFSLRDYSSFICDLTYSNQITGKVGFDVGYSRRVGVFETSTSTYTVTSAINTGLNYEVSSKLQADVNLRVSQREFMGRGQFDTSGRNDHEAGVSAQLGWSPYRNFTLTLKTVYSTRNSTIDRFDFKDTLTSLNLDFAI